MMDRNHRNKKHSNWNKQKNNNPNNIQNNNQANFVEQNSKKNEQPNKNYDDSNSQERQKAILELKNRQVICPKCNQPILEVATALTDKATGKPMHFECALSEVEKSEQISQNEKIAYIGQGRFGVLYYENPRDQRHFTIKKIIEWEDRDNKPQWRDEYSELYSKIN